MDESQQEGTESKTAPAAAGAHGGPMDDVEGGLDPFAELANGTTYTHPLEHQAMPLLGCTLFDRRSDEDILRIARKLSVSLSLTEAHTPPRRTITLATPLCLIPARSCGCGFPCCVLCAGLSLHRLGSHDDGALV